MKKSFLFVGLFVPLFAVVSCKSPSSPETPKATVASVSVTSANSSIQVGQTEQMTATITMSDGSTKAATGTWGSDNMDVASVDQSGLVTAVSAGTATIYIDVNASTLVSASAANSAASVTSSGSQTGGQAAGKNRGGKAGLRGQKWGGKKGAARNNKEALEKGIETESSDEAIARMRPESTVRGSKSLTIHDLWSRSGTGANVFDMPSYVERVKIVGDYRGSDPYIGDNFVVWVGSDLLVNEILGTYWGSTHYEGIHLTTGGVVQVKYSNGVVWSLTEMPVTAALTYNSRNPLKYSGKSAAGKGKYEIYLREVARKD